MPNPTLTPAAASDAFRRAPDRLLDVGHGEAAYRRLGTGPDVVFLHGWPVSSATFRKLLPHLVDHVTCHLIDLPGAGSSRFSRSDRLTLRQHITTARRVVDLLGLHRFAVVGHDSGGLIARHAFVGDERLRSLGLIDTETPGLPSWRFRSFLAMRHLPALAPLLGWLAGRPRLCRSRLVFGDAFADRSHLDADFVELFLTPLHLDRGRSDAAARVMRSFDRRLLEELAELHRRIDVPVQLVWGERDAFLPVAAARAMGETFPDATLTVVAGAGLFCHEERPAEVAAALLPVLC